jgi:hypothetical protein
MPNGLRLVPSDLHRILADVSQQARQLVGRGQGLGAEKIQSQPAPARLNPTFSIIVL